MNPLEFLKTYSRRIGYSYNLSFREFNELKTSLEIDFEFKDLVKEVYRLNELFYIGEVKNKRIFIYCTDEVLEFLDIIEDLTLYYSKMISPEFIKRAVKTSVKLNSREFPPVFNWPKF